MESDEEKRKSKKKTSFISKNRNDGFNDHSDYSVFLHYVDGREK